MKLIDCYECKYCKIEPIPTEIDGIEVLNPKCTYFGDDKSQEIVWANDGICASFEKSRKE